MASSIASSSFTATATMLPIFSPKKMLHIGNPEYSSYKIRPSFTPSQSRRLICANVGRMLLTRPDLVGQYMPFQPLLRSRNRASSRDISVNALKVTCAQTETVTSRSSTVPVTFPGKEKTPMLDDGGSGFNGNETPPYYRGDDGGGGGGTGGGKGFGGEFPWGPFWFFIFLRFLMYFFSKDRERDMKYKIRTGRDKRISHFLQ